ncbi:MAG: hypothetical protein Q9165_008860, partial [Trypethelium subeluteriae]
AFLQEKARLASIGREVGQMLLFAGFRNPDHDYLYRAEFEEFESNALGGSLNVYTAFSRNYDQAKTYVQDKIEDNGEAMLYMLLDQDAAVYVCGSATMSRGVGQKIDELIQRKRGWDDGQIRRWRETKRKTKRWQEDYVDETDITRARYTIDSETGSPSSERPATATDISSVDAIVAAVTAGVRDVSRPSITSPVPQADIGESQSPPVDEIDCGWSVSQRTQAVLFRHYIQEIGPRFDLCDSERRFSQLVPLRARCSETLLNAIYTISARHLVRMQKYQGVGGVISWDGETVSDITSETALQFHNKCIKQLLESSKQPDQIYNEDLLAASIILRTDEEMDAPSQDERADDEFFMRVISVFINAQIPVFSNLAGYSPHPDSPATFYDMAPSEHPPFASHPSETMEPLALSSVQSEHVTNEVDDPLIECLGLRQACLWVALRQELHAALMAQRPINFQLSRCDEFRQCLSPARDVIWANRIVIFCADIIEFCYGNSNGVTQNCQDQVTQTILMRHGEALEMRLPPSFKPIHCEERDLSQRKVFPEIWFQDEAHTVAATYMELTKILLINPEPTRLMLGPGHKDAMKRLSQSLRESTARLCGIALNNKRVVPIFLNACSAIVLCSEHFSDPVEQEALLWFLDFVEYETAYPTQILARDLRFSWSNDKQS